MSTGSPTREQMSTGSPTREQMSTGSPTREQMSTGSPTREKIPHPATEALDLATIMRALGDPVRLEIVRLLADRQPRLCGEIYAALGLPNSTGSYHLRTMREAGLTRHRPAGTQRHVSLRREDLEARFPGLVGVLVGERRRR